jgi:hypothetical protein
MKLAPPRWPTAFLVAATAFLVLAGEALAQAVAGPPPNPNPAGLVMGCTVAYAVLQALVSALRDDNPALPFHLSARARVAVLAAAGALLAPLLSVTQGTPWWQAAPAALATVLAVYGSSGASRTRTSPGAAPAKSERPPAP